MLTYFLFIIGFYLLIKGADYLVGGASSLAKKLGVSPLVIGLTIVSFGTSAPELVVNMSASLAGNGEIAIGNVVGSNIANILLILGITAIIYPLSVKNSTVWKEIPLAILASLLLGIAASDQLLNHPAITKINGEIFSGLTRIDGLIFLSFFIIFLYYTFGISKEKAADDIEIVPGTYSTSKSLFMISAGLIGLGLGGNWVVDGAIEIATYFNISEALIGLTVVAIGTSLPELATSAVAAYKKDVDIAVGNVIGSNIFNIFLILGISSTINPLSFSQDMLYDTLFSLLAVVILFISMFIGKKHTLERWQGANLLIIYFIYICAIIIRG